MKRTLVIMVILMGMTIAQPRGPMGGGVPGGNGAFPAQKGAGIQKANSPGNMKGIRQHNGGMHSVAAQKGMRGSRHKNKDKVEMMMMWSITEELSLNEEQAAVLFPKMNKHREEMQQIERDINVLGLEIRTKLESEDEISDKFVKETLEKMQGLEHKKVDGKMDFLMSLDGTLSNEQIILLSTFERHFRGEMKERMQRERGMEYRRGGL